jgi:hypothetical protein
MSASPRGNKPSLCLFRDVKLIFWSRCISSQAVKCFHCHSRKNGRNRTQICCFHTRLLAVTFNISSALSGNATTIRIKIALLTYTCLTGSGNSCSSRQEDTGLWSKQNIHYGVQKILRSSRSFVILRVMLAADGKKLWETPQFPI